MPRISDFGYFFPKWTGFKVAEGELPGRVSGGEFPLLILKSADRLIGALYFGIRIRMLKK